MVYDKSRVDRILYEFFMATGIRPITRERFIDDDKYIKYIAELDHFLTVVLGKSF